MPLSHLATVQAFAPAGGARVLQGAFLGGRALLGRFHGPPGMAPGPGRGNAVPLPDHLAHFRSLLPPQSLPPVVLARMEDLFGADLSAVRIHVSPDLSTIGALAAARGSDLFFAPGQYTPTTPQGRRLLGHELAHVLQQRSGRARSPFPSGTAVLFDPGLEAEAERFGLRAGHAAVVLPSRAGAPPVVHRPLAPGRGLVQMASLAVGGGDGGGGGGGGGGAGGGGGGGGGRGGGGDDDDRKPTRRSSRVRMAPEAAAAEREKKRKLDAEGRQARKEEKKRTIRDAQEEFRLNPPPVNPVLDYLDVSALHIHNSYYLNRPEGDQCVTAVGLMSDGNTVVAPQRRFAVMDDFVRLNYPGMHSRGEIQMLPTCGYHHLHAEMYLVLHAFLNGLRIQRMGVSKPICPNCRRVLDYLGIRYNTQWVTGAGNADWVNPWDLLPPTCRPPRDDPFRRRESGDDDDGGGGGGGGGSRPAAAAAAAAAAPASRS